MRAFEVVAAACLVALVCSSLHTRAQDPVQNDISEGERVLRQGNYHEAREAAERALRLEPRSAEAENLAGTAAFALGDLSAAESHLHRAVELRPGLIAAHRALAATYLAEKKFKDARREFLAVLAAQPRDFVSLYSLGLTFLLDDQPVEALKRFERASQVKPHDPTLLAHKLEAYLKLKQQRQAEVTLADLDSQLSEADPRHEQIAALLVNQGAYPLAAHEFELLRKAHPDSYEVNYNLALAYHRAGREADAAGQLHRLLAAGDNAELEDLLGEVELSRGHGSKALAAYGRAVELDPDNEDCRYDYAQAFVHQWALDQALQVFAEATKDFPRSARLWLGWGATYYLAGRYAEAAQTLLSAAEIAPDRPDVYYLLGRDYDAAGSFQVAIEREFSRYLSSKPQDAWAEYFYGRILSAASASPGRLREAQEHLERAVAIDSKLAEAHTALGDVLDKRGEFQAAMKELERSVQLDPQSSVAFYKLAQLYRKLGQMEKAQQAAQKFQQLKEQQRADLDREQIQRVLERAKR
jgi:tetratricopeptide (TPR) repeat protein